MIKVEFTKQEMESLAVMVDTALRAKGLRIVKEAAALAAKMEAAIKAADEQPEAPATEANA